MAVCAAMLLGAYGEASNARAPAHELFGRTEAVLATSRELRLSLDHKRLSTKDLAVRNARLAVELRAAAEALVTTGKLLRARKANAFPHLTSRCEPIGRLTGGDAALAKEVLARMAAQLAGRVPDERVRVELAGHVAFDDHVWRYHDFIDRAERAFAELAPSCPQTF